MMRLVHFVCHPTQCTNVSGQHHTLAALPLGTMLLVSTDNEPVGPTAMWMLGRKEESLSTALCLRYV
jgi:hypothetical protein